jgi:SAM-dependent methyltransferase
VVNIMYSMLKSYLCKPKLYEKTQAKFWNDPHISKGMLRTHLDPNTDAASRKPETIERSVEWISSLLPHGAKLLDIGCGPGLYTSRLSERGFCVTGLDFSERSIEYAKAQDAKTEYVLQDYLEMEFEDVFDMVTLIWCDYGALIPQDRHNLLDRVNKALKPGGLFLFDVFSSIMYAGCDEQTSWEVCEDGGFWSPNPHICLNAQYHYCENNIGLKRTVVVEDGDIRSYSIWNTCFTKESLASEVKPHGFDVVDYYSDVTGKPYDDDSETICVVLRKSSQW